jgi:hypothetical protein
VRAFGVTRAASEHERIGQVNLQTLAGIDGPAMLDGEVKDLEASFVLAQQRRGLAFQTGSGTVKGMTVCALLIIQGYSPCFIFSMAPAPS